MILALAIYGFAPYGWDLTEQRSRVRRPDLSFATERKLVVPSVWGGPPQQALVLLGALYAPCMRRDRQLFEEGIEADRQNERDSSGCCVRRDGSGCFQTGGEEDCQVHGMGGAPGASRLEARRIVRYMGWVGLRVLPDWRRGGLSGTWDGWGSGCFQTGGEEDCQVHGMGGAPGASRLEARRIVRYMGWVGLKVRPDWRRGGLSGTWDGWGSGCVQTGGEEDCQVHGMGETRDG